ncbi:Mss4-like protein [Schizothecium vesticola]|uniref:Mss4-like protein n=1 Tax=Schizothecium vesticola TaxID=314040 RepID=A0AA40EIV5_9PEZI|nr:Mss4-like protein [Schizothecium vesticola]
MPASPWTPLTGGCPCQYIRYTLTAPPLITHCCHCTYCQRESGSAFVINALFTAESVIHTTNQEPILVTTPSLSGKGQIIARCPKCFVAVWSNYSGGGEAIRFVRAGTLELKVDIPVPDVHIYVGSKVEWVRIPERVETFEEFYDVEMVWGREVDERRWEVLERIRTKKEMGDDGQKGEQN